MNVCCMPPVILQDPASFGNRSCCSAAHQDTSSSLPSICGCSWVAAGRRGEGEGQAGGIVDGCNLTVEYEGLPSLVQ